MAIAAAFNPDTDVNYAAYLAAVNAYPGWQRARFDEELIKILCWYATGTVSLDATDALPDMIAQAKAAVAKGAFSTSTSIVED